MKKATDIRTELWNQIISDLCSEGWRKENEYTGFDKGIDFDSCSLRRCDETIHFEWDNWTEGEITCSSEVSRVLSLKYTLEFKNE